MENIGAAAGNYLGSSSDENFVLNPVADEQHGTSMVELIHTFQREGFLKVGHLLKQQAKSAVREDVYSLLDQFVERNEITVPTTGNTPRKMSTVRSEKIAEYSKVIQRMYRAPALSKLLETIAGEKFLPCPSLDEEFLITKQDRVGDTHGWHWGDYSFALIWIIDTPPVDHGGMLQCVPHTRWNKSDPRINEYLCLNLVRTYSFVPGDIYLLRSDTTLHRTVPLSKPGVRTILNMTWGSAKDANLTLKDNDRWWADDGELAREELRKQASQSLASGGSA